MILSLAWSKWTCAQEHGSVATEKRTRSCTGCDGKTVEFRTQTSGRSCLSM